MHHQPDHAVAGSPVGTFPGSVLAGLRSSTEAVVVLSSLARACPPAFGDVCAVALSDGTDGFLRVSYPPPDDDSGRGFHAGAAAPATRPGPGGGSVSTPFSAPAELGYPSFAGVIDHSWARYSPTAADVAIARLLVEYAVQLLHTCRLERSASAADERAAGLAVESIASDVVGQAVGMTMLTMQASEDEARRLLRRRSRSAGRELHDVARDVVRDKSSALAAPPPGQVAAPGRLRVLPAQP